MASTSLSGPPAEETRNWMELPIDVTVMILQKVGAIHILTSAQMVCMAWREICKDPAMWRSIDMRNLGDLGDMDYDLEKMAIHAIDRSCGHLVDINVEYFGTDELLEYIADRSSKLRRLRLVCCYCISDDGLSEAAKKFPLLEELHIFNGSFSKETLKNVGCCCPLLISFNMNTQGYRPSHMECDDHALAIAEYMPGLRHLQLFGNKMTNDGLQAILDGCPHLESLDIRQCFNVYLGGSLGERVSDRIKNLRDPYDSIEDYGFASQITEDDSFDDYYPSGFSDIDFLSDNDKYYEFFGESDLSDYEEPFFY